MAFKAHKEFFDASVFLGMRGADDGFVRHASVFSPCVSAAWR
jgi:hypothetical protein